MERPKGAWLLALSAMAALVAAGEINLLSAFRQAGRWLGQEVEAAPFQAALAVMIVPGAFLAALPGRIRRRKEPRLRSTWQGCVTCFALGAGLMLAAGLSGYGDGLLLTGLMLGSVSAWAFAGLAWLTAFFAARLHERRRRA